MQNRAWVGVGVWVGMLVAGCGSGGGNGTSSAPEVQVGVDAAEAPGLALPDAGAPDAGAPDAAPVPAPVEIDGFTHYVAAHGVPADVRDVSGDARANVWVAGYDGLYLLRAGRTSFEKFTQADGLQGWNVLSVAGLGPDEVAVGYEGVFGGLEDDDPEWMLASGGVDRARLVGTRFQTTHWTLGTPPNGEYPQGQYKLRTVWTIRPVVTGQYAGDIWFGGTHGVAMWSQKSQQLFEHQHPAITQCTSGSGCILMAGDHWGLAFDAGGNVWIGNAHREALLRYGDERGNFWAAMNPVLDTWPDDPIAYDKTKDDGVKALAVDGTGRLWIGSVSHGLAIYDPATGTTEFVGRAQGAPDDQITALAADPDGSVWVGTYIGLGRWSAAEGWRTYYSFRKPFLPSDWITSLQVDTRTTPRTVYIGTDAGVSVYRGP